MQISAGSRNRPDRIGSAVDNRPQRLRRAHRRKRIRRNQRRMDPGNAVRHHRQRNGADRVGF